MIKLADLAEIFCGFQNRSRIEPESGSKFKLIQARDIDFRNLNCLTETLTHFDPKLGSDINVLRAEDILFLARGERNYSVLLSKVPSDTLAAACFFVIRIRDRNTILSAYLFWYLNQQPAQHYLRQYSGHGVNMPVVRRAVLENMLIPVPPMNRQKTIADMFAFSLREMQLTALLSIARKRLIESVCLRAVEQVA